MIYQLISLITKIEILVKLSIGIPITLFDAVYARDKKMVEHLISNGKDINTRDCGFGNTPLHLAVKAGDKEMLEFLIEKGANVNQGWYGYTPLHLAVEAGNKEIVELLIEKEADVNQGRYGYAPLHLAIKAGNKEMVELLIEKGANVNQGWYGYTPLYLAVEAGNKEIVELLIEKEADVNQGRYGYAPLYLAIKAGNKEMVELLIEKRADVNQTDYMERAPLHLAVEAGNKEMVELLIEKRANVNQADYMERAPLHLAVEVGNKEIVELLIKNGADIDTRDFARWWQCIPEDIAKLMIGRMDVSDRSYLLESLKLLQAKDCGEQVKMWCESKVLRDYCIEPALWRDKYPDLVNETTNMADMVMKEIFLRNNCHWKDLIDHELPLGDMQKDLGRKIQRDINAVPTVYSWLPKTIQTKANELINTNTDTLQPPKLESLLLSQLLKEQKVLQLLTEQKVEQVNFKQNKLHSRTVSY